MIYKSELKSSCLCEVRYDDSIPQLTVVFTRNKREANWPYAPKSEYDNLVAADSGERDYSVGEYFNSSIYGARWFAPTTEENANVPIPVADVERSPESKAQSRDSGGNT